MSDEPAFPSGEKWIAYHPIQGETKNERGPQHKGMTLRDYFAAKVMSGLVTSEAYSTASGFDLARIAYSHADEMLKARAK